MKYYNINDWFNSLYLTNTNCSYVENIYKDFLNNPNSVNNDWKIIFNKLIINNNFIQQKKSFRTENFHTNLSHYKLLELIDLFRSCGHEYANLDPLGLAQQKNVSELDDLFKQIEKSDQQQILDINFLNINNKNINLSDLMNFFKKKYCGNIGFEYMYLNNIEEKKWIQERIESTLEKEYFPDEEKIYFLKSLIAAEGVEQYLGNKFPSAKRFSLEGCDVLILILKKIVHYASKNNIKDIVLGMAHRGRLNVLLNILGKRPKDLFNEFIGNYKKNCFGTGDVKYHQGFSSDIEIQGNKIHLSLAFNPSHLEIINPVIMGSARARIERFNNHNSSQILPITLHGDAAIIAQGVVQETFNMSKTCGYDVGGSLRIVINNQIGFTTSNIYDSRSTKYCTDIAKMIQAPIFHVNADDPEAAVFITKLALEFRQKFQRDVLIDLVCYRRHGHNEADEPSVTQPIMYKKIKNHPTLVTIYSDNIKNKGILSKNAILKLINSFRYSLDNNINNILDWKQIKVKNLFWHKYSNSFSNEDYENKLEINYLKKLAMNINEIPKNIEMHSLVSKIYYDRKNMVCSNKPFDWGSAENLAYATLLDKGISIRLSGQDTARGTFFHRHATIHNQKDGSIYIPLANIHDKQGNFYIWNSALSEEATLAFEYGYSTTNPFTLVIWEAQFGDFANNAQVVIDQFISAGEQKWGRMCGLIMLLPHGYEGQGPEHSSARLERYLQLCAEQNMQVFLPSNPSQIYHILRYQALCKMRRPMIIMSPKSLLRHPMAVSSINDLSNGKLQQVIDETDDLDYQNLKRVIMCSGKVYYDLLYQRRKNKLKNVAIIRIEQLYPFPLQKLQDLLMSYKDIKDFIWCQEEPKNQGAWYYSKHYLKKVIPKNSSLNYVGRLDSAAPAVGYTCIHNIQQEKLIQEALYIIN